MKKIIFLFTMVLTVSMVMAQSNKSTIAANGDNNQAKVVQTGLDNYNELTQTKNNIFDLEQNGEANYSKFRQALYGSNEAYVEQLGNRNKLAGNLQGEGNLLNLHQKGNDNWTKVYQDARGHEADIVQVGDFNKAEINQDAPSSTIDIDLIGDYNETYVKQRKGSAADFNEAIVNVTGSSNGDGTYGDAKLEILQDGLGNFASTVIVGDYNDADISQEGDFNEAWNNVTGDMNVINVLQTGNGNYSMNTVVGSNNTIAVTQGH